MGTAFDNVSGLMGKYGGFMQFGPMRITALLYEGTLTPTNVFSGTGLKRPGVTFGDEIKVNDIVELKADHHITSENVADGHFVVQKLQSTGARVYIARVVEIMTYMKVPSETISDFDTLLDEKYLRYATIEPLGMVGFFVAPVHLGGSENNLVIGAPLVLNFDVSEGYFTAQDTDGTGQIIALNSLEASSVAVDGYARFAVGWQPIQVV